MWTRVSILGWLRKLRWPSSDATAAPTPNGGDRAAEPARQGVAGRPGAVSSAAGAGPGAGPQLKPNGGGADTADPTPPRPPWHRSPLLRRIGGVVASLGVIVLTPFLLLSENTIKGFIDSWLNDCVIVFERKSVLPNRVKVTGHVSGKAPGTLPITFAGHDGVLIKEILFTTDVDQPDAGRYVNLALHPMTQQKCPGALCKGQGKESRLDFTVEIGDISSAFRYVLSVEFDRPATENKLGIFVKFAPGLPHGVCRVEYANPFNFLIRATKAEKFGLMLGVFAIASALIAVFKRVGKGGEGA